MSTIQEQPDARSPRPLVSFDDWARQVSLPEDAMEWSRKAWNRGQVEMAAEMMEAQRLQREQAFEQEAKRVRVYSA